MATSPALMLGRLPNESMATMFFTLSALRCMRDGGGIALALAGDPERIGQLVDTQW
jgi:hypothetical protein